MNQKFGGLSPRHFRFTLILLGFLLLIQVGGSGYQSETNGVDSTLNVNDLINEETVLPVRKAISGCELISRSGSYQNEGRLALAIQLAAYDFHESAIKVLREILESV